MNRNLLLQVLGGGKSPAHLPRLVNLAPPFRIRVVHVAAMKAIDVERKLRFANANFVGTHFGDFGGSLFAMTDPFCMLVLIANRGRDYIVWDKARSISLPQAKQGQGPRGIGSPRCATG